MQVSRAYISAFVAQLDALNVAAGRQIVNEEARLQLQRRLEAGEDAYGDVQELMHRVVPAYTRLASALTCHFYDGIRQASDAPGEFDAQMYEGFDEGELNAAAYAVAQEVAGGTATKPLASLLADTASRYTRNASNNTVRRNAAKDPAKPRYCIVPGPSPCVFCKMRASAGYTYPDAQSAESHNHCSCQAVQVYSGQRVQGYDPDAYRAEYDAAADALRSGDLPDELKERLDREKAEKGAAFDRTHQVLMVWRYQQNHGD